MSSVIQDQLHCSSITSKHNSPEPLLKEERGHSTQEIRRKEKTKGGRQRRKAGERKGGTEGEIVELKGQTLTPLESQF